MTHRKAHVRWLISAMLGALLSGCVSDDKGELPTAPGAPEGDRAPFTCDTACVLFENGMPFRAARSQPDSAESRIEIGSFRVQGEPGGVVTARLSASPAWWDVLPDSSSLDIAVNKVRRRIKLDLLQRDYVVHEFDQAGTAEISFALRKEFDSLPDVPVRLLQQVTGARVLGAVVPWRDVRPKATFSITASSGTPCAFNAPGTWCGVGVGIAPFSQGTAWTGTGFQSASGSGASSTIRITFDRAVSDFAVSVYDPDFAGNRVVAYNASGGIVGSMDVPGDNTPGSLTVVPVTITAGGIRAVDLIPAGGDYVAYDGATFILSRDIVVTCTPNPVQRGEHVTCRATPPQGASTVTVSEWRFESTELTAPVIEQTTALEWVGAAATSGTVTVTGEVDGEAATGDGPLVVSARAWGQKTVNYTVEEVTPSGLPPRPAAAGDLGNHEGHAEAYFPPNGAIEIQAGPNRGVFYFTEVPVQGLSRIRINRVALSVGSEFYNRQPRNAPPGKCIRDDVVPFLPLAEEHEGLTLSPTSHAGVLRDELNRQVPQATEHVVALGDVSLFVDKAQMAAQPGIEAAKQASRDQINGGTVPPIPYCAFKYF